MSSTGSEGGGAPAPVWSKRVGDASVAARNVAFCAGYDVEGRAPADERLAPYDLLTNAAHLIMLTEADIVPRPKAAAIAGALRSLSGRLADGEQLLRPACEDIHMSIESLVAEIAGEEAAGHMHTARSRNDQVATDMRLWMREEVSHAIEAIAELAETIGEHAQEHAETVCPGFTHGQPGMVTSWGHWTMSYLPRLLRDVRALRALLTEVAACPLGAAASFGTGWPINRERTAELLGFKHPTLSGADGIWARGELERRFAFALAEFLSHLSGVAQDLILLSSPPRDWIILANEHVTGSSIMPQKRNPDFAEVTRARAANAYGIVQSLAGIGSALPSGYNRDTQWTKYLVFDAADNAAGAAELYGEVFERMTVNREAMKEACGIGFLNATDIADYLARTRKIPFRACYRALGPAVKACEAEGRLSPTKLNNELQEAGIKPIAPEEWGPLEDFVSLLAARNQTGNPSPEQTINGCGYTLAEINEEFELAENAAKEWREAQDQLWQQLKALSQEGSA